MVHARTSLHTHLIEGLRANLPPLRVNAHGDASVWPVTPGPPLGAMPDIGYSGTRLDLGAHDTVVLYSDGLVEVPGEEITDGIQRLCRAAANAHTDDLEELDTYLLGLAGPLEDLRDDIAVLGFRPNNDVVGLDDDVAARVPTGELPLDPELVWRLIDAAPEAIIVVSPSGEILVPAGHARRHAHHRNDYLQAPSVRHLGSDARFAARHRDGTDIDVHISLSPIDLRGDTFAMASVRRAECRHGAVDPAVVDTVVDLTEQAPAPHP